MVVVVFLQGCDEFKDQVKNQDPPISISIKQSQSRNYYGVLIVEKNILVASKEQQLTIKKIMVNRGNCKMLDAFSEPLPATLNFGEVYRSEVDASCNVLEVAVNTNRGEWTFTFKQ